MDFTAAPPRLTDVALPERRFLPGDAHAPHLPDPLPLAPLVTPDQWRDCPAYLYGCDLYNHGYWWESHELWELIWRAAAGDPEYETLRHFTQGLIQVAACAIKLEQRKARGLRKLLTSSENYLREVIERVGNAPYMGLRVHDWHASVRQYYSERFDPEAIAITAPHDAASFPYLQLSDD
ncbi:MAG: DUF309 domain-containing protein [Phycisphaerales bacterium]|nr:MAG: DUF309 domain-containing protein [Phycisphaerales bacterium]